MPPAEDKTFLAEAVELLPAEPWDENTWSSWTTALKAKSGRKGRGAVPSVAAGAHRPRGRTGA